MKVLYGANKAIATYTLLTTCLPVGQAAKRPVVAATLWRVLLSAELNFGRTVVPPVEPMEEHHDF
jgi:hypothetical protein